MLHQGLNFRGIHKGILDAQQIGAGAQQCIAAAHQLLGAIAVQDGTAVHLADDAVRQAGGEVGLDDARDDIDRRPLRGDDQVQPGCTTQLRQADDGRLYLLASGHHQVG